MSFRRSRRCALVFALVLATASLAAPSAGAASEAITGTVTGTIETLGVAVPVPAEASFTGTRDATSGATKVTMSADPLALALPLEGGELAVTTVFANPGGFTGTAKGTTAALNGSIRLSLSELSLPGAPIELPPLVLQICALDFDLHLTGTWDEASATATVAESDVAVPALSPLCTMIANPLLTSAVGQPVDLNEIIASLPAGSVSLAFAVAQPEVPPVVVSADEAFVLAAYEDFLGRTPTADDLAAATAVPLTTAQQRARVVSGLARSPEWVRVTIDQLYLDTLGRTGDAAGVAYWVGKLQSNEMSVAQVAATFYSSSEYFQGIGRGNVTDWVKDLYVKVLRRTGDAGGVKYWTSVVAVKGRASVAYSMVQSPESRNGRVQRLYQALLGRDADAAGLAYWSAQVKTTGDLKLAEQLASSAEYYARASARR